MMKEKYDYRNEISNYQTMTHKFMFTQMNTKKGMHIFGECAVAGMFKERKQTKESPIPRKPVFEPQDGKMTPLKKKKTLEAVNLIKEKRDRKIKGHTGANGSKQKI